VRYGKVIGALVDRGLLVRDDRGVRLTCLGLDFANLVFEQFV
jgi:hypothetical protein